jgi:hypothetical protein
VGCFLGEQARVGDQGRIGPGFGLGSGVFFFSGSLGSRVQKKGRSFVFNKLLGSMCIFYFLWKPEDWGREGREDALRAGVDAVGGGLGHHRLASSFCS